MLIAAVLNPHAVLNTHQIVGAMGFIPGEATTLVIKLQQPDRVDLLRYVPISGSTLTVTLPLKDGSVSTLSMTAFADDRSIWSVALPPALTENLTGGNFTFDLTEAGVLEKGWVENGLSRIITGGC